MSVPAPAFVHLRALSKCYGPVEALHGVNLEVCAGEICGLLGLNGAGKTTTLECLLGLRRPDSGDILIDGIDALAQPARVKPLLGAQLQGTLLQAAITPRAALHLFAAFYATPAAPAQLLARFALTAKADARFDTLSAGQKQRLLLALALVNRPRLLVLDEPTAGLDPAARHALHQSLREIRAEGGTILLSTHDLAEAQQLCDRIAILHEGRIVAHDTPAALLARADALPQLTLHTRPPLPEAIVAQLPAATRVRATTTGWCVTTRDPNRTITGLATHLAATGGTLVELQMLPPSMEEVFHQLTGQTWTTPSEEVAS